MTSSEDTQNKRSSTPTQDIDSLLAKSRDNAARVEAAEKQVKDMIKRLKEDDDET